MIRSTVVFVAAIVSVVLHGAEGRINGPCRSNDGAGSVTWSGICIRSETCDEYGGLVMNGGCPGDPRGVNCCYIGACDPRKRKGFSHCEWTSHACPLGNPRKGTWKNSKPGAAFEVRPCGMLMCLYQHRSLPWRQRLQVLLLLAVVVPSQVARSVQSVRSMG